MDLALILGKQVCSMLIYIIAGFIAYRKNLVSIEQSKGFSSALMYIFAPCMLFQSFQRDFEMEKLQGLLFATIASLIANFFFVLIAKYVFIRKETATAPTERSSVVYTNAGYMAIPLIGAAFGMEAIFYSTGYLIVFNIFLWTHCLFQISGDKSQISFKKVIFNPSIIAIFLGLLAFIFGLRLPTIISTATIGMSNLVAPLSLFIIGIILGSVKFKELFSQKRVYYIVALRLIVFPLLLLIFFKAIHFTSIIPNGKGILTIVLVAAYAPIATSVSVFCQQFDKDAKYASKLITISTCLCVISMPIMLAISQFIL